MDVKALLCRLDAVATLEDDWDHLGSLGPWPSAVSACRDFVLDLDRRTHGLVALLPQPEVVVTPAGSIRLAWDDVASDRAFDVEWQSGGAGHWSWCVPADLRAEGGPLAEEGGRVRECLRLLLGLR